MKKCLNVLLLHFFSLFIVSANAMAATTTEIDLQTFFDSQKWGLDAEKDRMTMPGSWTLPIASGAFGMAFYYKAPDMDGMELGIYSVKGLEEATVFDSGDTPEASATLGFYSGSVFVLQTLNQGQQLVDYRSFSFSGKTFGFWFGNGTNKYYSGAKTSGDFALLAYKADNGSYVFAGDIDGDKEFGDFIFQASSIKPVPTPAPTSMVLLGLGILGLAGFTRKK